MSKKLTFQIKVDEDWLDQDQLQVIGQWLGHGEKRIKDEVISEIVDKIIAAIKLPEIKIEPKEIKDRMLDILAERALEGGEDK